MVLGVTVSSTGVAAWMVKPAAMEAASPCVVSVTVCIAAAAAGLTVMFAIADSRPVTVRELTVTPGPKVAVVIPAAKLEFTPVMATATFASPCLAVLGERTLMAAGPATTLKALGMTRICAPVVTVRSRRPVKASGVM